MDDIQFFYNQLVNIVITGLKSEEAERCVWKNDMKNP